MKLRLLFLLLIVAAAEGLNAAPASGSSAGSERTGLDRTAEALALHRFNIDRQGRFAITARPRLSKDQGNVSVMQDDGTLIIPLNPFDLSGKSLTFTPRGNGYVVQAGTAPFDSGAGGGSVASLGDDDAVALTLPFPVAFYGATYHSIFLNTDGNLTFGSADSSSEDRNLRRVMSGPPRIAPLFDDLLPSGTGQVYVERLSDRLIVTWLGVREFGASARNTFQVVLRASGAIQFNYQTLSVTAAVVGLSPGSASSVELKDLSMAAQAAVTGVVAEVFSNVEQLDLAAISANFYNSHQDAYDHLMIFTDFDIDLQDAFAYEVPVRNDIQGIMPASDGLFDFGTAFGSSKRLAAIVNGGAVSQYPADPRQVFLGSNNTLEILGQEFGHRWLAFVDTTPSSMLGRDLAHWSFFMNTFGSVMEGNEIEDLGNGQFRTVAATYQYSPLDQYIMGLRSASEVPPWFVVTNPSLVSAPSSFSCRPLNAACEPTVGVQMRGARRDLTIQDVISAVGQRVPDSSRAQKDFSAAFILITRSGQEAKPATVAHLDNIRVQWQRFFVSAVGGRATMTTQLLFFGPVITSVEPQRGLTVGGTQVLIKGSGFEAGATVTIGGEAAAATVLASDSIEVTAPHSDKEGVVSITVTNPSNGQPVTLTNAFTYYRSALTELRLTLPSNGIVDAETAAAPELRVGYGVVNSLAGMAVLRSFSGPRLVSEAGVPPSNAALHWTLYAEKGANISTGVAIANPNTTPANLILTLNDGQQSTLRIPASGQRAAFVDELFTNLQPFLGALTIVSDVPVAVMALRGTVNIAGDFIMSTIPLTAAAAETGVIRAVPSIANGAGYNTELILLNSGRTVSAGSIDLSFAADTDAGSGSHFPFNIPAGGVWRLSTLGAGGAVANGYAVINLNAGSPAPEATAIIRLSSGGNLISETAMPAQIPLSRGLIFGANRSSLRTGIAILNPYPRNVEVTLAARNVIGNEVERGRLVLGPFQQKAAFLDELLPAVPDGFEGAVLLNAASAVYAISLRGTVQAGGGFLMAALPVVDLDKLPGGPLYFPQIVAGGSFSTEFLFAIVDSESLGIRFVSATGEPLGLSLQ